jgi:hypothetical protein
MSLAPLLAAPPALQFRADTVRRNYRLQRQGRAGDRAAGYACLALMAIAALFIHTTLFGG